MEGGDGPCDGPGVEVLSLATQWTQRPFTWARLDRRPPPMGAGPPPPLEAGAPPPPFRPPGPGKPVAGWCLAKLGPTGEWAFTDRVATVLGATLTLSFLSFGHCPKRRESCPKNKVK